MTTLDIGQDAMAAYCAAGRARAYEIGNRGPVRFVGDGALHPDIVEADLEDVLAQDVGAVSHWHRCG